MTTPLKFAKITELTNLNTSSTKLIEADGDYINLQFQILGVNPSILGNPGHIRIIPSFLAAATVYDSGYQYSGYYDYRSNRDNRPWQERNKEAIQASPLFFIVKESQYSPVIVKTALTEALSKTITNISLVKIDGRFGCNSYNLSNQSYYGSSHGHDWTYSKDWQVYRDVNYHLVFELKLNGIQEPICVMTSYKIAEMLFGLEINEEFEIKVGDNKFFIKDYFEMLTNCGRTNDGYYGSREHRPQGFDYTLQAIYALQSGPLPITRSQCPTLLKAIVKKDWPLPEIKPEGVAKVYNRAKLFFDDLLKINPFALCSFRSFAIAAKNSVEGVKISTIFNELFSKVESAEEISKILHNFWLEEEEGGYKYTYGNNGLDEAIKKLPIWKEKRKAVIKSKSNKAFGKLMQEFEFLSLDEEKYPITTAAIKESGEIPVSTFFRKDEQYFLLNDNWDLWEEMLIKHRVETIQLANEVKGRTTYEKDLMSYFYFVLYALPEYLESQTGKKWTCSPKLVTSANELEPPVAGEEGISRQRSALTPIVDNDNCTVEVPYASLAIGGGYGTTYCYSHDYHVLTKGFSFGGNVVANNVEHNLNGKDDYGLMFYTLTGSSQGRGYPTFLIIFERRSQKGDTKVHFHRTHPTRSKNGDYNPIHHWTRVCYNWMAGNVNRSLIKAQQGDLFFVETEANLEFNHKVNAYDKHTFEIAVNFAEYDKAAKSNILGYIQLDNDTKLSHTEHDDVIIPKGTYAIHQCRSWEANPKGVWSLRID